MDHTILDCFLSHRVDALTPIVVAFTMFTGPTLMWFYSIILGVITRTVFPPIAVGAANLISHVSKRLIDRPRPDVAHHLVEETNAAMPSGHSVGAAAFAMAGTLLVRRWWTLLLWVLGVLIGLSRLYVGVHWPSDLMVGWLMGAIIVLAVYTVFQKISWHPSDRC